MYNLERLHLEITFDIDFLRGENSRTDHEAKVEEPQDAVGHLAPAALP